MAISKETGGSFEVLTTALARASVNLEKTTEAGGKTNKLLFALMGGAKGAAELGLKPMDERIQTVLQHIFALNDVGQRNTALTELLGRNWMNNVLVLKLLAEEGYGPTIEMAKKFGFFYDKEASRQAKEYTIEVRNLKAELVALGLSLGKDVMPYVEYLFVGTEAVFASMKFHLGGELKILSGVVRGDFAGAMKEASILVHDHRSVIDFAVESYKNLQKTMAAAGKEPGGTGLGNLGNAAKETSDRLAELLEKEREEAEVLAVGDNKRRQALKTYDDEVRAIDQAIAAARRKKELTVQMEQEAAQAKTLALQNYETKVRQIEDQEEQKQAQRYARLIQKAIAARLRETEAARDAATKITAIEDRYFNDLDRDQNQLVSSSLAHQQQILQNEIATHKLRGSKAAEARDQIIAIERQKTQLQAQEEIKRIQLDVKRTVAEINDQYKTLLSAAKTEQQKTAILRQQEAERVQIMQAGEQQIQGILRQTEQEQRDYQQAEEDSAAATLQANISMVASQAASLLQTLGLRKAAAYVEMVMQTAAAFGALAVHDYWGAAQHFMSAAEYGIIAKQSVSIAGAGGGGGGGGSVAGPSPGGSAGGTAAPSRALAPGAAGAAAAALAAQAPRPTVIHIHNEFKGPIYGGQQGLDELMRHMTRAVTTRDVRLVASHAVNPVPVSTGKS
jgi:hypothetical protein